MFETIGIKGGGGLGDQPIKVASSSLLLVLLKLGLGFKCLKKICDGNDTLL